MTIQALASRVLRYRRKAGDNFEDEQLITVALGAPEPFTAPRPEFTHRCAVAHGGMQLGEHYVYGVDAIHALILAIGSISTYCDLLAKCGQLCVESGEPYDPKIYGLEATLQTSELAKKMFMAASEPPESPAP